MQVFAGSGDQWRICDWPSREHFDREMVRNGQLFYLGELGELELVNTQKAAFNLPMFLKQAWE